MADGEWEFDETSYPVLPGANWGLGKKKKKMRWGRIFSEQELLRPVRLTGLTGSKRKLQEEAAVVEAVGNGTSAGRRKRECSKKAGTGVGAGGEGVKADGGPRDGGAVTGGTVKGGTVKGGTVKGGTVKDGRVGDRTWGGSTMEGVAQEDWMPGKEWRKKKMKAAPIMVQQAPGEERKEATNGTAGEDQVAGKKEQKRKNKTEAVGDAGDVVLDEAATGLVQGGPYDVGEGMEAGLDLAKEVVKRKTGTEVDATKENRRKKKKKNTRTLADANDKDEVQKEHQSTRMHLHEAKAGGKEEKRKPTVGERADTETAAAALSGDMKRSKQSNLVLNGGNIVNPTAAVQASQQKKNKPKASIPSQTPPALRHGDVGNKQGAAASPMPPTCQQTPKSAPPTYPQHPHQLPSAPPTSQRTPKCALPISQHTPKASSFLQKMQEQLQGGRFRQLNELLYTKPSGEALQVMQCEPELFDQYHRGFEAQTRQWPQQPVDVAVAWLAKQPKSWRVADFGCGDARLGRSVQQGVVSLDLVASAPGVLACNMADTPLETGSMDAIVFCLSLMGTDYGSFLEEAARVTKSNGWIWVAEVKSRFVQRGNKEDIMPFVAAMRKLGFSLVKQDVKNTMFVVMLFKKKGRPPLVKIRWPPLKACVYKRR